MGLYIKNMELPKEFDPDVYIELHRGTDGENYARLYNFHCGGLSEWCEIIPISVPHGRLTDVNMLKELLERPVTMTIDKAESLWEGWHECTIAVNEVIDAVPTIIEAEEGE